MKKDLTQMVFILDMSGSMYDLRRDTIGGFNSLIEEQKKEPGDALVTTALFDDRYILLHDGVNIKDVGEMTAKEYAPCGMTALLDAIGKTVNLVGQRLADMPEEERPEKVIVTIVTDGMENASEEYDFLTVRDMIKHQREKYSWIFTFIGADIDTERVGGNLGIDPKLTKGYTKSGAGAQSVYTVTSQAVSLTRSVEASNLTNFATIDSLSNILDKVE